MKGKRNSAISGVLAVACLIAAFTLRSLGSFVIWIFGGAMVFCLFMAIFHLIPPAKRRYTKKIDPEEAANRTYIAYHLPMVISLLLGGLLLALIVIFFAS
jgi:hypothetical protein